MKRYLSLIASLPLLVVAGCSSVSVRELIGDAASIDECKQLEGVWLEVEEQEPVHVRRSKSGELNFAALEWDDEKQQFATQTIPFVITKSNDLRFLHIEFEPESPEKGYLFFRYEIDDDHTVRVYFPEAAVFEQAVAAGKLRGHVNRTKDGVSISLEGPGASIAEFIKTTGPQRCFKEKQATFKRLKRFE